MNKTNASAATKRQHAGNKSADFERHAVMEPRLRAVGSVFPWRRNRHGPPRRRTHQAPRLTPGRRSQGCPARAYATMDSTLSPACTLRSCSACGRKKCPARSGASVGGNWAVRRSRGRGGGAAAGPPSIGDLMPAGGSMRYASTGEGIALVAAPHDGAHTGEARDFAI